MTKEKGNRRSIRLPEYDYSQPGAYFVTICVQGRECALGEIENGEMTLSQFGEIAAVGWDWLGQKFLSAQIDVFCIMPNHTHAIISLIDEKSRGALQSAPTKVSNNDNFRNFKPLGRFVGAYKTHTTVQINRIGSTHSAKFWQRNYYERIIRNQKEYDTYYEYILANPLRWEEDENYPSKLST